MAKKKLAMGRGLGAILSETAEAYEQNLSDNSSLVLELDVDIIKPNPYQPRKTFNLQALQELSESIKEHGLLQPVVVIMAMEIIFLSLGNADSGRQNSLV